VSVSQIINVIVNSKGAVTVKKQLDDIGNSAKTTTTYLNSMRAILAAALTFSGVGAITETIDNFTQLQNRLKLVTSEAEGTAVAWDRLMAIANGSYSTIDNTVNLYYRVAQAFKSWGESAQDAYEFTESFQKAAILSGSTMQTTAQAVYQFSQALNKGKLDGDEFRSVLEGLPYVANIIQKSLGKTRAELYEMSKAGEITVDRIKQAFEEAAKTIESDWSKITPTIGMAMNIFRNNWTDFIGDIQNSTGIFSVVAQAIILVANNFHLLAIALSPVALSIGFLAGRAGLGLVVMGLRDLAAALNLASVAQWIFNAAVLANPYVIAAVALAALVAGIIYFADSIGITTEYLTNMWNVVVQVFSYMLMSLNPITALINLIVQQFGGWLVLWQNIKAAATVTIQVIMQLFSNLVSSVSSLVSYLGEALSPVFSDLIELAGSFYSLIEDLVDLFESALVPIIQAVEPAFNTVWTYIEPALVKFIGFVKDVYQGWYNIGAYLKANFFPIIKDVFEGWIKIIRAVIGFIQDMISALRTAIALAKQLTGLQGGGGGGGGGGAHYGAQFYAGEFASGGQFKVGGTGAGRDTTPVSFMAERGERVTVETRKQQRQNDNDNSVTEVNVPVQITNVFDPQMVVSALDSREGIKRIKNVMAVERDSFRQILGVV
jgi:tape measure domain-containing protein